VRAFVLATILAALGPSASASPALPAVEGPDVPALTDPTVVVAIDDERWECQESARTNTIDVPSGGWDRIIVEVTITPEGDPWDRVFGVAIGGVEVLRGTTPRTEMTLTRDITAYRALLPSGGRAEVSLYVGTYVGAMRGSVRLFFHADEPTAAGGAPYDAVHGIVQWDRLDGHGDTISAPADFGAGTPSRAVIELTLSGHGGEEFWYQSGLRPRLFHVLVDSTEVATAVAMPYVYALLGFGNANANTPCVGPGTSPTGDLLHPVMWWSGQRAADAAGVHTGAGEIPAYRAEVEPAMLPLLQGERTVEVVQEAGGATWITSLSVALEYS
jgi:hypothetical protein